MKKNIKKTISVLLAVIIAAMCMSVAAFATDSELVFEYLDSGIAKVVDCNETATGIVVIPAFVKNGDISYKVKQIDEKAFEGCEYVTEISIPEGVTSIGSHAFRDCTALTDVHIPKSLVTCSTDAFEGCNTVVVHCYKTNYQFFTVYGLSENLKVDILDAENGDLPGGGNGNTNMTSTIIDLIKNFIYKILAFLKLIKTPEPIA